MLNLVSSFSATTNNNQVISSFLKSFVYAWQGMLTACREEVKMRIHISCAFFVVLISFYLHLNALEWIAVIGCIGLVMMAELFNTALETLADHISPSAHEQIKKVKDMAAGAVLIAAIAAAIIWLIILIPHVRQAM